MGCAGYIVETGQDELSQADPLRVPEAGMISAGNLRNPANKKVLTALDGSGIKIHISRYVDFYEQPPVQNILTGVGAPDKVGSDPKE